jgi:polyhydroxyalkanoate synthesis regulator phasin
VQTGWLITVVASIAGTSGWIVKKLVDHLLGRGQLKADEATKIRTELRGEIDRKNDEIADLKRENAKDIANLESRLASLEQDLEKVERERNAGVLQHDRYKLDVYRALIGYGADKELVDIVLAIQERP